MYSTTDSSEHMPQLKQLSPAGLLVFVRTFVVVLLRQIACVLHWVDSISWGYVDTYSIYLLYV